MDMALELHMIQNFAPSNLNRDEDNQPKDCIFGGYRRARISSQCIKRSVRRHPAFTHAVEAAGGDLGKRTKRLKGELIKGMEARGKASAEAETVARSIIGLLGLGFKGEKTQYLLFLGQGESEEIVDVALKDWDALTKAVVVKKGKKGRGEEDEGDGGEDASSDNRPKVPKELKETEKRLKEIVGKERKTVKGYAADIALFGRMIADKKNMNVDAACQVAHAISTNKVEMETDFFTAVDDLLPDEETGSDMMGGVEFNSSCFYRYSLVNLRKLAENLGFNKDLLSGTVRGYIEASIKAIPTGHQNSMAAHNPPSFVRAILRKDGFPWNLANAFQEPVRRTNGKTLERLSIDRLNEYYQNLSQIYGTGDVVCDVFFDCADADSLDMTGLCNEVLQALDRSEQGEES